jgi:hypothetical protein
MDEEGTPDDDAWEYVESALGCLLRFVFYVAVCIVVIAVVLAIFIVFLEWFTNAIASRSS